MEDWLKVMFGKDSLLKFFAIERAHRVPFRAPPPGSQPRPFLIKLLYYKDEVIILQKAREIKNIQYNGTWISIYPDFSPELQKQRARFIECKRRL